MSIRSTACIQRRSPYHGLLVLLVTLGLLASPCVVAASVGAAHCLHHVDGMQELSHDALADGRCHDIQPAGISTVRAALLPPTPKAILVVADPAAEPLRPPAPELRSGADPPPRILFCSLHN